MSRRLPDDTEMWTLLAFFLAVGAIIAFVVAWTITLDMRCLVAAGVCLVVACGAAAVGAWVG